MVRVLVTGGAELGAGVNVVDDHGDSCFHLAVRKNHIDIASALCRLGADIDFRDKLGCTGFYMATTHDNLKMMEHLINMGCDIDISDAAGYTPLSTTILNHKPKAMRMLVDYGAAVNKPTVDRNTPLSIAVEAGFAKTVEYLIANGAKPSMTARDRNGFTPAKKAALSGYRDCLDVLIKHGATTEKEWKWAKAEFTKKQNFDTMEAYRKKYLGMRPYCLYIGKQQSNYGLRVAGGSIVNDDPLAGGDKNRPMRISARLN